MKSIVAVAQMTSKDNKEENLSVVEGLLVHAAARGVQFLCLPENFAFMGPAEGAFQAAEDFHGPSIKRLCEMAKKYKMWLSLGGFQRRIEASPKIANCHIVIDAHGIIIASYNKLHLFSVRLPDGSIYDEDSSVERGDCLVTFSSPFFMAGLSICYDVRFAHLFWALRERGAEVLLIPAAFTETSGKAHWEVLLRARAIETQSYVLAAAQIGKHSAERSTHGHAMIVDPWGVVIAQCGAQDTLAIAQIDTSYVKQLRHDMPLARQRVAI